MDEQNLGIADAALSGFAGALALTTVHQLARSVSADAPRMDVVGMRALVRGFASAGTPPPDEGTLYNLTLAGDLASNSAYYALAAVGGGNPWVRGTALGLAAGAGALLLPRPMGLGDPPKSDRAANQVMTVAWYLIGGLAAAATAACLRRIRAR
jgi:hypothetical protein